MSNLDLNQVRSLATSMAVGIMNMENMLEIMRDLDEKQDARHYETFHVTVHTALESSLAQVMSCYENIHRLMAASGHFSSIEEACPDMETALNQLEHGVELMGTLADGFCYGSGDLLDKGNFPRHMYFCYLSLKRFLGDVELQREAMHEVVHALPQEQLGSVPKVPKARTPKATATKRAPEQQRQAA